MSFEILDNFLKENAKAMSAQSYVIPSYLAVSTSTITPDPTHTSLPTEKGNRFPVTASPNSNTVVYEGTRSASAVLTSTGDTINAVAAFSASTGGTELYEISIPSLTQTTNFDIVWNTTIGWTRE